MVRCSIAPYPGGSTLSISGVFQPGDLPFSLLLHGSPSLDQEDDKLLHCKGDLIVNDMKVGTLAVYRDPEETLPSAPAPTSRVRVKIFVIEIDSGVPKELILGLEGRKCDTIWH